MIERTTITSRADWLAQRRRDVTASDVGALFGVHPYRTAAALYNAKKFGIEPPDLDNMMLARGRALEKAVAEVFGEQRPDLKIEKANEYVRDPDIRMGCTPDFFLTDADGRRGNLQTKTTNKLIFGKSWLDSPPVHIALQTAGEAHLLDVDFSIVAVLIVDGWHFDCVWYEVPRHEGAEHRIVEAVKKFWRDVEAGDMPQVDYERDADLIALMFPAEVPGKVIDLRTDNRLPELLADRAKLIEAAKSAEAGRGAIDAEIKLKMGDAESALVRGGWTLTLKQQVRKAYEVKESTFRVLRVKPPISPEPSLTGAEEP